jgi:hypothetical protein
MLEEEEVMIVNMETLLRTIQHSALHTVLLNVTVERLRIQPCETVLSDSSV